MKNNLEDFYSNSITNINQIPSRSYYDLQDLPSIPPREQTLIIPPQRVVCNPVNVWQCSNVAVGNFNYIGNNAVCGSGATPAAPFDLFATMINIPSGYIVDSIIAHLVNKHNNTTSSNIEFYIQRSESGGGAQTNLRYNKVLISNDTLATTTGSLGCLTRFENLSINAHSLPILEYSFLQIAVRDTLNVHTLDIGFIITLRST